MKTDKGHDKGKGAAQAPKHTTYFLTADCPKSHSTTTVTKVSHSPQEHVPLKPSVSCDSVDSFFFSDVSVISRGDGVGDDESEAHEAGSIVDLADVTVDMTASTTSATSTASTESEAPSADCTDTTYSVVETPSVQAPVEPPAEGPSVAPSTYPYNHFAHLKSLSVVSSKPASLLSMDSASSSPRLDASDALLSETLLSSDDDDSENGRELRMPQFIMPTIPLPSRRPFTEAGLRLGKLRVLVAGQKHSGKSALIRSLVQQCQDIVFVDAAAPLVTPLPRSKAARAFHEPVMWETQASTRPTAVFEVVSESSTLTETASPLDFNVSFVECSSGDWLDHATAYLEQQLQKTSHMVNPLSPSCSKIMTTSAGMDNVDVCLFLLAKPPDAEQLEQMRVLSSYVPLIPLVAKSDALSDRKLAALKLRILRDLESEGVLPFAFDLCVPDILSVFEESDLLSSDDEQSNVQSLDTPLIRRQATPQYPFAVSSVAELELDASVLMNPNYTPKLVASDLDVLCGQLFSEKGASWLRYKAGQQFIQWAVQMQQAVTLRGVLSPPETHFYIPEFVMQPVVPLTIDHNLLANQSTVDWISQLKTESGVLVQVTQSRGPAYNCLGGCSDGKHAFDQPYSHSIADVDPLELKRHFRLLNKLVGWACKALSYTLGASLVVKMVTVCIQGELYAPPPSQPQVVSKDGSLNDVSAMLCRVFENVSRELMAVAEFSF
ncbi:hypothetical protein CJU89_2618 [Yarrowia sp. B02]|nr:hypothetical protein CJU89_2618 [Yarrowia sp. B02]